MLPNNVPMICAVNAARGGNFISKNMQTYGKMNSKHSQILHWEIFKSFSNSSAWLTESKESALHLKIQYGLKELTVTVQHKIHISHRFTGVDKATYHLNIFLVITWSSKINKLTWMNGWILNNIPVIAYRAPKKTVDIVARKSAIKNPHLEDGN